MLSRMIIKKQPGRRWLKYLAAGGLLTAVLAVAGITLAVHDLKFQLDGDVSASTGTNVGGSAQPVDWDSLFNSSGGKLTLPSDFTASAFTPDFNTTVKRGATVFSTFDGTTYTTGSKDTLDINPGWQCASSNNVLSKNDIMNAYSVAYTNPVADANGKHHQILYFALERNSNNGDANVAFWFLQDEVGCDSSNGTATWSGHHLDGDILIVSAFTNGGGVSGIDAYRWNDADGVGGAPGSLGTTSVAHGKDCTATAGLDTICATTNGGDVTKGGFNSTITTPWLTANTDDGVDHKLQPSEFFEGGIDLTANNLGDHCFNTFVGDTRSSQSLTATIFDYALGTLGECTSTTSTNPVSAADTSQAPASTIPGDPNDARVDVKDKTVLDVTGIDTFSGSISWHICGPTASNSTDLCTAGGVDVGSQNVTADGTYYSPTVTVTAAGRYCFRAEFSGDADAGVPGSSDSDSSECFTVAPRRASISTTAGADVDFGQPVTDSATLTNTAHKPGTGGPSGSLLAGSINPTTFGGDATGTITFTLYKSDCTTLATGTGTNPQTTGVTGNGTYGPVSFTPDAPGTYHWVATYGGDTPNTLASLASDSPCPDTTEDVVVSQIPTSIATTPSYFPQDSATVASTVNTKNLPDNGTVTFRLYDSLANCQAHGITLNSGGLKFVEAVSIGTSPGLSKTVGTSNTSFRVSDNGTYYWWVTYAPGNTAFTGRQSNCAESIAATLTGAAAPGTLFP